ncbi:hypothetical protein BASA62_006903 [Batrachochytrium salamandrivorans]|nr:hypothetical protein BASA62_006903 [Batrachochytrium salamandrivorans]
MGSNRSGRKGKSISSKGINNYSNNHSSNNRNHSSNNNHSLHSIDNESDNDSDVIFFGPPTARELRLRCRMPDSAALPTVRKRPKWLPSLSSPLSSSLLLPLSTPSSSTSSSTSSTSLLVPASSPIAAMNLLAIPCQPTLTVDPLADSNVSAASLARHPLLSSSSSSYLDEDVYFCISTPTSQSCAAKPVPDPWSSTYRRQTIIEIPCWKAELSVKTEAIDQTQPKSSLPCTVTGHSASDTTSPFQDPAKKNQHISVDLQQSLQAAAADSIQRWMRHIIFKTSLMKHIRECASQFRISMQIREESAIVIQHFWHRWTRTNMLKLLFKNLVSIQRLWRLSTPTMQSIKAHLSQLHRAQEYTTATEIVALWSGYIKNRSTYSIAIEKKGQLRFILEHKAVMSISRWWSLIAYNRWLEKRRAAAVVLQSFERCRYAVKRYKMMRLCAVRIQRAWRAYRLWRLDLKHPKTSDGAVFSPSVDEPPLHDEKMIKDTPPAFENQQRIDPALPIDIGHGIPLALPISKVISSHTHLISAPHIEKLVPSMTQDEPSASHQGITESEKIHREMIQDKKRRLEEIRQKKIKLERQISAESLTFASVPSAIPTLNFGLKSSSAMGTQPQSHLHRPIASIHTAQTDLTPLVGSIWKRDDGSKPLPGSFSKPPIMDAAQTERITCENTHRNAVRHSMYSYRKVTKYGVAPPSPTARLIERMESRQHLGLPRTFISESGNSDSEPSLVTKRIKWNPDLVDVCSKTTLGEHDSRYNELNELSRYGRCVDTTGIQRAQTRVNRQIKTPNLGTKRKLADYRNSESDVASFTDAQGGGVRSIAIPTKETMDVVRSQRRKSCIKYPAVFPGAAIAESGSSSICATAVSSSASASYFKSEPVIIQCIQYAAQPVSEPTPPAKLPPKIKKAQRVPARLKTPIVSSGVAPAPAPILRAAAGIGKGAAAARSRLVSNTLSDLKK